MGFAEDEFRNYLRKNLTRLDNIKVDELLTPLSACLSRPTVEKLNAFVKYQGNGKSVLDFYLDLSRSDNWVRHFIDALRYCEHNELAEEFEEVYSSFQIPKAAKQSSPRSLPSLSHDNRQPPQESPYRSLSPPASQPDPSPKPSHRFNNIQPGREVIQSSPSQQNHEFRSLPPFTQDPPAPPGTSLSRKVSAPIHSDRRISEDDSFSNPVPETAPYQKTPLKVGVEDKPSISDNLHIGPDPLPSGSLSPSLKEPLPEVPIRPSSEDVSLPKVPETQTPSYSPSTRSEGGADNWRGQSVRNKVPETRPTLSVSISKSSEGGADNRRGQAVRDKAEKLPEQNPAYMTVHSGQEDHGGNQQHREQFAIQKEAGRWDGPSVSASSARSVREKVVTGVQHRGQSAYQAVDDVPDGQPASFRPANRETTEGEPSRERPANERVLSGSSCRPLGNNDEEYFSKPGVLMSTAGPADGTNEGGESSVMSQPPVLQISDITDSSQSSNPSARSSTSITQDHVPRVSTPNERSMQTKDKRSPEENDFRFDLRSSPGRSRQLDRSSSKQPEENSFESRGVSQFRLDYKESPEADLMGRNDDALRNRPRETSSTAEPNDRDTQRRCSNKAEARDRERSVLITITVASLCLSLYLLWKSRHN